MYQQGKKYKRPTIYIQGRQKLLSRVIMEGYLKRKLKSDELIHHKNGNTFDNRLGNLLVVNRSGHKKLHPEIGMNTRLKKKYFFDKKELLSLYFKHKKVILIAKIYGCQEMTIERALKIILNCKSLKQFAKRKGWKNAWR